MSIRFTTVPEEANAITHSGNFHADEIFSIVFLEKVMGDIVVFRSDANMPKANRFNSDAIIFDIGYGKFDHHQKNGNGYHFTNDITKLPIPYASFGLLWEYYGKLYCASLTNNDAKNSQILWEYIENRLVISIDAYDNGIYPQIPNEYASHRVFTISSVISIMNPIDHNVYDYNPFIAKAIDFAKIVFETCIKEGLSKIYSTNEKNNYNNRHFSAEQVFSYVLFKRFYNSDYVDMMTRYSSWKYSAIYYHNTNSPKKPIPYSKVGSIWEQEGHKYCASVSSREDPEFVWDFIRTRLIVGIDAIANNINPTSNKEYVTYNLFTLSNFIESLNPTGYSTESYYYALTTAINVVNIVLISLESKALAHLASHNYVEKEIRHSQSVNKKNDNFLKSSSKHILVFDKHVHWQDWLYLYPEGKDIWFVVSPSSTGGYIIQPVRDNNSKNGYRKGFPRKWHGLNGEDLRQKTNIPTANFIHSNNGFLAGAEDLEGAIKLAEKAFSNQECERKFSRPNI